MNSSSHNASVFWRGCHIGFDSGRHVLLFDFQASLILDFTMSEHFKLLWQLLALSGEMFEEELHQLVRIVQYIRFKYVSDNTDILRY